MPVNSLNMSHALIVDDDHRSRDYLKNLLKEHGADLQIAGEASNIHDAEAALRKCTPDVVFLDVEMPGGSGFDLLRSLGTWHFGVIFTTAFDQYAIQAIGFSALDYLLKPVQPDELNSAILRFKGRQSPGTAQPEIQKQFLNNIGVRDEKELKLTLSIGDRAFFVSPSEVNFCYADGNYTEVHLFDGRRFVCARTLKEYEEMLRPWEFLRVHRSSLVNRRAVEQVTEFNVVMKNGQRIGVSRRKRDEVRKALGL